MFKVYKVWCEYDMGSLTDAVYTSKLRAMQAIISTNWSLVDEADYKSLMEDGLLGIEEVELK